MVFSAFFCRILSLGSEVCSSPVKNMSSIHSHIGGDILHVISTMFSFFFLFPVQFLYTLFNIWYNSCDVPVYQLFLLSHLSSSVINLTRKEHFSTCVPGVSNF